MWPTCIATFYNNEIQENDFAQEKKDCINYFTIGRPFICSSWLLM